MTKNYHENQVYSKSLNNGSTSERFDIRDYVEFDAKGRGFCPACSPSYNNKKKTLSAMASGAYKCFRGCTSEDIRAAIGQPKDKIIPSALAAPLPAQKISNLVVSSDSVEKACIELIEAKTDAAFTALKWLKNRGITPEMARHYRLGLIRTKAKGKNIHAIAIPIPASDGKYFQKKRIAPWENLAEGIQPWAQKGIKAQVWFTHHPQAAKQTWLCEGEWDAICLGWLVKESNLNQDIAVACFTCGCSTVPPTSELNKLTGLVKIFYDRNDKLNPKGEAIGEAGAKKVAAALGERAAIALVPMPDNCTVKGWDVSDAINVGYSIDDFEEAANMAVSTAVLVEERIEVKPQLKKSFTDLDFIMDSAAEYIDWLVPDLLTNNELFLLAAPPRGGKSLLVLTLAHAIATGGKFLDRPVQQGKVLYYCLEDADVKLKQRLIAQGWSREAAKQVKVSFQFNLGDVEGLEQGIVEHQPLLVVIDTLSRARFDNFNENSAEIAQLLSPLQDLATKHEVCILLVHHTNKTEFDESDNSSAMNAIRGSGAIRATCRGALVIAKSKQGIPHLLAENGYSDFQNLPMRLNPDKWTWELRGNWKLDVNLSQKDQVLEYLKLVGSANVAQIAEATDIPQASIYKVLTRLVKDEEIGKEGQRYNTTYYLLSSDSSDMSDGCQIHSNLYIERDTAPHLTKNKISRESCSQFSESRNDSENLRTMRTNETKNSERQNLSDDFSNAMKSMVSESDNPSDKSDGSDKFFSFTQNNGENNSQIGENNSHTTSNFFHPEHQSILNPDTAMVSGLDNFESEATIDSPMLDRSHDIEWVRLKDGSAVNVIRKNGNRLRVRRPGEQKEWTIKVSDCTEIHHYGENNNGSKEPTIE